MQRNKKPAKNSPCSDTEDLAYLSDINPNDKPWDKHRANADKVRDLYQEIGYEKYVTRIQDCSRLLEFVLKQSDEEQIFKLNTAQFCHVRHCPVCQWRRSLMWKARFLKTLPKIFEAYPNGKFLFLTLTQKHRPIQELRDTITWMNKSWNKLVARKCFPGIGWVKSLEITKGQDGLPHPHFHILIMVDSDYFRGSKYLSKDKWIAMWRDALKVDYNPSVWISSIKTTGKSLDKGIVKALSETLKYSIKESDLTQDAEWLKQITNQLHKTRSVSLGGVFKEYLSEQQLNEPENLIHAGIDESEILDTDPRFKFIWRELVKRYQSI